MPTGELEHRVNNTLAVVAAVVERTRESTQSVAELRCFARGRIRSMARTQSPLKAKPLAGA